MVILSSRGFWTGYSVIRGRIHSRQTANAPLNIFFLADNRFFRVKGCIPAAETGRILRHHIVTGVA